MAWDLALHAPYKSLERSRQLRGRSWVLVVLSKRPLNLIAFYLNITLFF